MGWLAKYSFAIVLAAIYSTSVTAQTATPNATPNKKKTWHTYPQPPKVKPADPLKLSLAQQIPEFPENYVFKTTDEVGGKKIGGNGVSVFELDSIGRPRKIGTLPTGVEFKMTTVHRVSKMLYYGMLWDRAAKAPAQAGAKGAILAFVHGNSLVATAYTPPVQ